MGTGRNKTLESVTAASERQETLHLSAVIRAVPRRRGPNLQSHVPGPAGRTLCYGTLSSDAPPLPLPAAGSPQALSLPRSDPSLLSHISHTLALAERAPSRRPRRFPTALRVEKNELERPLCLFLCIVLMPHSTALSDYPTTPHPDQKRSVSHRIPRIWPWCPVTVSTFVFFRTLNDLKQLDELNSGGLELGLGGLIPEVF